MPKEGRKRTRSKSPINANRHHRDESSSRSKRRRDDYAKEPRHDKEKDRRPDVAERLTDHKNSLSKVHSHTDKRINTDRTKINTKESESAHTASVSLQRRRTSSSSDSSSESRRAKRRKKKAKKHKKSERKQREKKRKKKEKRRKSSQSPTTSNFELLKSEAKSTIGPLPNPEQAMTAMAPMTKTEWEKQQSVIRRVLDPETGRQRLVKGDGEIIEEIVSLKQHKEINKQATSSDGMFFQKQLLSKKN